MLLLVVQKYCWTDQIFRHVHTNKCVLLQQLFPFFWKTVALMFSSILGQCCDGCSLQVWGWSPCWGLHFLKGKTEQTATWKVRNFYKRLCLYFAVEIWMWKLITQVKKAGKIQAYSPAVPTCNEWESVLGLNHLGKWCLVGRTAGITALIVEMKASSHL